MGRRYGFILYKKIGLMGALINQSSVFQSKAGSSSSKQQQQHWQSKLQHLATSCATHGVTLLIALETKLVAAL